MSHRLFVLALPLLLLVSACGDAPEPSSSAQRSAVPVRLATADYADTGDVARYAGSVEGARRVTLSAEVMGPVARMAVAQGDRVRAGQPLVWIDDTTIRARRDQAAAGLREAEASRQSAETHFGRIERLHAQESATQQEFDDAGTRLEAARARVGALEAQLAELDARLGDHVLTAPFGGVVAKTHAETGDLASPGRPLVVLDQIDRLEVAVQVPETAVGRFVVGDTVSVDVPAVEGPALVGRVAEVAPAGSPGARQFTVQVTLPEAASARGVQPGMFARIERRGTGSATLTVPADALVRRGQLTGLYTLADDVAVLRWVRTGRTLGDRIEILSGLAPGESFVIAPEARLTDGQPVQIVN